MTWIQEALKEKFTLVRALHLASQRLWDGQSYSASTLESWYYQFRAHGFAALHRKPRKDKGTRKALSPQAAEALLAMRRPHPHRKIKVLVRQLVEKGTLQTGTFSLPSVYRLLAEHGLEGRSLKNNPHRPQLIPTGPTCLRVRTARPKASKAPGPMNCG